MLFLAYTVYVTLSPPSLCLVSLSSTVVSAVVVAVQVKENNVAETHAVATNAAPFMALGQFSTFCVRSRSPSSFLPRVCIFHSSP